MAHFAKLDENNIVKQVVVVDNSIATDEAAGITFLQTLYGTKFTWKQTSYNQGFRKNFAGIDFIYDSSRDAFIERQTYPSWVLNESTCRYDPPHAYPGGPSGDGKKYKWSEEAYQANNENGWSEID